MGGSQPDPPGSFQGARSEPPSPPWVDTRFVAQPQSFPFFSDCPVGAQTGLTGPIPRGCPTLCPFPLPSPVPVSWCDGYSPCPDSQARGTVSPYPPLSPLLPWPGSPLETVCQCAHRVSTLSAIQLCRSCHIFPPLPCCLREALFKPSFIVVPGFPSLSLSFPFISNASANSHEHKFSDGSRPPPRSVFSPRHTNSPDTLTSLPLPLRHTPNFPRLFGGLNTP